ncbi:MAG: MotA/TolQ/ExbB proton channel family protein, partial [Pirellulales bacterium]
LALCAGWVLTSSVAPLQAQPAAEEPAAEAANDAEAEAAAAEALGNLPEEKPEEDAAAAPAAAPTGEATSLLVLLQGGGVLMIPIIMMLVLTVALSIERLIGLRREKVLPHGLVRQFGDFANAPGGFDPRKAYRACQQYPCAASNVIRAMLLKIGRPHAEVEHAVREASEREAARLYSNVRWLNLAAAVTPLMGLFGTVWGMMAAFDATVRLPEGVSKAEMLGEGIVIALVTTLGGLAVAIPAAILAHYYEGRIQGMFRQIDELLFSLLPQVERYEGKLRVSREVLGEMTGAAPTKSSGKGAPRGATAPAEEPAVAKTS